MKRSGAADLPLHGGRVPSWLAERMTLLGTAITETIVRDYGASAFLSRLSDPFWFQALGAVMGMDWHSSGITTSVMGALKRGLGSRISELGIHICGGRGKYSRNTPNELRAVADREGFDGGSLVRTSRLTARIDNNAIADGFQIYLHNFVITGDGEWAVIQQGLNDQSGMARRYHWHSAAVKDFVAAPHTGIVGESQGIIMNLVDVDAAPAQTAMLDIAHERPDKTLHEAGRIAIDSLWLLPNLEPNKYSRYLRLPRHHEVRAQQVDLKRLGAVLAVAYERGLNTFSELLLLENLGPRTLQSLALIAEVIHGTPSRFDDPARFSFAHGGKDGHPFPVPLKTYDESIGFLRNALDRATVTGRAQQFGREKLDALRRLNRFVHGVEKRLEPQADFEAVVAHEKNISASIGGRSVLDDRAANRFFVGKKKQQRSLF